MARSNQRSPIQALRRDGRLALAVALFMWGAVIAGTPGRAAEATQAQPRAARSQLTLPLERPDDPPAFPPQVARREQAASTITFGRFTSVQVNVSGTGADIVGDAANEPTIAVDPAHPNHIAIGWRQFDFVSSNFRQAGYGYSTDGGVTWATGKIDPGVFRSDPVLGVDAGGDFFYNSLTVSGSTITSQVFPSTNGGASWGGSVFAYGGDKQWMTIDRTGGTGNNHFYQAWSTAGNSYAPNTFNRSNDDGASFQTPSFMTGSPVWGTLDFASDGTLYVAGTDGPDSPIYVARSTDARNALVTPTFTTVSPNLGGAIEVGGPNPDGLVGQLWLAVDRSGGPRNGWVYVLASVKTPNDPMDVNFIRSSDGGQTWSPPVRVNDDPPGNHAWQWFGTMSVAPNGRIDAVWNDSRGTGDSTKTCLRYSCSFDGGATWSSSEQASPVWDSTVGWPNQLKIGDYYHMISDAGGADLAWSATFNGGQDIYFMRIAPPAAAVADRTRRVRVESAFPNPFSSSTTIRFDVPPAGARVKLEIFDPAGHRVATLAEGFMTGGTQLAHWSGTDASGRAATSGIYFCRYQAAGVSETRKLMLIR